MKLFNTVLMIGRHMKEEYKADSEYARRVLPEDKDLKEKLPVRSKSLDYSVPQKKEAEEDD